jgi:hypothetical protein
MAYTETAVKTLTRAVPTVNADNKAISWDIEVEYSFNNYVSRFTRSVNVEPSKSPSDFTKLELWGFVDETNLDLVYESQYVSTQIQEEVVKVAIDDFDVDSLA